MKGNILYDEGKIKIVYNPNSKDEHLLYLGGINDYCAPIPRGILEELSQTKGIQNIERKIKTINDEIIYALKVYDVPISELALAFAQARLQEEKDFSSHLLSKIREEMLNEEVRINTQGQHL